MDKHGITFYTTYSSVDLAHREIFCVKVGIDGIIDSNALRLLLIMEENTMSSLLSVHIGCNIGIQNK